MPLFFCAGRLSIFVLRSKRMDMLKGITWGQFSIFILVAAGVYYLYVLLSYYRAEAFELLTRRERKNKETLAKEGGVNGASSEADTKVSGGQAELFGKEGGGGEGNEQFQQMQRAIAVVRQVIEQGIENKLDRENLLDHIKEVLGDYRHLRKTEYGETINNYLIRVCSSELSLELDDRELARLWK
jgi:hypothetical protein